MEGHLSYYLPEDLCGTKAATGKRRQMVNQ